jgi:CBS domain-containing protein
MPFTVKDLLEGRAKPVTVQQHDSLQLALELMIEHDYSQLPVVNGENEPLGLVTSDSILRAMAHFGVTLNQLRVADAIVRPEAFKSDEDLFELLDELRDSFAVLIKDTDGKLTGIVTSYDTTEYFRKRGEDIMLVEDIENYLKDYIKAAFINLRGEINQSALETAIEEITPSNRELKKQFGKALNHYIERQSDTQHPFNQELLDEIFTKHFGPKTSPKKFEDLSLGEFIDLFLHDSRWQRYSPALPLDKNGIRKILHTVRDTRNNLMHFRQETTPLQRDALRRCQAWLAQYEEEIKNTLKSNIPEAELLDNDPNQTAPPVTTVERDEIAPIDEEINIGESRYALLGIWLQNQQQTAVNLTFKQIEDTLNGPLPSFAYKHRSWWANDSASHVQSQQWLKAGWRVSAVNILEQEVTFARLEKEWEKPYIDFFSVLLQDLRKTVPPFYVKESSPTGTRWLTVAGLPEGKRYEAVLSFTFVKKHFRVELFIKTASRERNKFLFDTLHAHREQIELTLGEKLSWERMDNQQASRIAIYHDGDIKDCEDKLYELRAWAVLTMIAFYNVMSEQFNEALRSSSSAVSQQTT